MFIPLGTTAPEQCAVFAMTDIRVKKIAVLLDAVPTGVCPLAVYSGSCEGDQTECIVCKRKHPPPSTSSELQLYRKNYSR
jgi:hypothetical protein